MGRVEHTPIPVGPAVAADADAIFAAVAAQTTNLEEGNFAEESLDRRSLESEVQAEQAFAPKTESGTGVQALTTTWATLNATSSPSSYRTGAIALGANERLRVVLRVEFESDAVQDGIPMGGDVQLRWRKQVSGTPSVIGTIRRVHPAIGSAPLGTLTGVPSRISHQCVIVGPASLDWVEVEISDQSGTAVTVQVGDATMTGMIYKRVTI